MDFVGCHQQNLLLAVHFGRWIFSWMVQQLFQGIQSCGLRRGPWQLPQVRMAFLTTSCWWEAMWWASASRHTGLNLQQPCTPSGGQWVVVNRYVCGVTVKALSRVSTRCCSADLFGPMCRTQTCGVNYGRRWQAPNTWSASWKWSRMGP